mmetsp:Transcript_3204/g.9774  ORF Transcript_3204/g.9774 Transcript_3204/m.9774 type:complete len:346 (-) Transcript_3204:62-1099(-)
MKLVKSAARRLRSLVLRRKKRGNVGLLQPLALGFICIALLHTIFQDRKTLRSRSSPASIWDDDEPATASKGAASLHARDVHLTSGEQTGTASADSRTGMAADVGSQSSESSLDSDGNEDAAVNEPSDGHLSGREQEGFSGYTSFMAWFNQEDKPSKSESPCTDGEGQKVCSNFVNIVKRRNVSSIMDVHCRLNIDWMPAALHHLQQSASNLTYHCSDFELPVSEEVHDAFSNMSDSVHFSTLQWWQQDFPKGVQLLFALDTLRHVSFSRVYRFFQVAKQNRVDFALFDNYPQVSNSLERRGEVINVRRHPFSLPAPLQVLQHIEKEDGREERQLVLYSITDLHIK